jgi:hypothetical protein
MILCLKGVVPLVSAVICFSCLFHSFFFLHFFFALRRPPWNPPLSQTELKHVTPLTKMNPPPTHLPRLLSRLLEVGLKILLLRLRCQYLYFCTSKASKVRTSVRSFAFSKNPLKGKPCCPGRVKLSHAYDCRTFSAGRRLKNLVA